MYLFKFKLFWQPKIRCSGSEAFTMSEVLITIGLIGLVAAMTLPTLINKTQEYIVMQQFKKVYNVLSNALLKAYSENGNVYYECYYGENRGVSGNCIEYDAWGNCKKYEHYYGLGTTRECDVLLDVLRKNLKVLKVCENKALLNGCVPEEMKGTDTILEESDSNLSYEEILSKTEGCSGFNDASIKNNNYTMVLEDGTIIGFYASMARLFWFDVNGFKGPNKWGHDIFAFELVGSEKLVRISALNANPTCTPVEKGGKSSNDMLKKIYGK